MRNKHILIVLSVVAAMAVMAVVVFAGNPDDPPGTPGATNSYTLEDIYNRLDTGAAGTQSTFTEPSNGPTLGTMHTLNEIYDLLGERAFVPKTGQTTSYATSDDGDLGLGADWITSTRFITGTTGVVTDTLTGLVWLENANCFGLSNWATALTDANGLANGTCGLTDGSSAGDWRLPNVRELQSLMDYGEHAPALPAGHPFTGVQLIHYWTSTTIESPTPQAWYVYLNYGYVHFDVKTDVYYVWPVRGGQ